MLAHAGFHVDDLLELGDEPRVDLAALMHFFFRHAEAQRLGDVAQTVRGRRADGGADGVLVVVAIAEAGDFDLVEAGQAGFKPRSAFCSDSAKVRPIAMTSPTDFMAVVRTGDAPGNFSKAKRGILVTT